MRITYLATITGQGGAERSVIPIINKQIENGHDVSLFLFRKPVCKEVLKDFSGTLSIRESGATNFARFMRNLGRAISNSDVIISSSEYTPTYIGFWLSRLYGKVFVAEVRAALSEIKVSPLQSILSRIHYPRIRWIRCVSNGVSEDLSKKYNVHNNNLRVIYNPFNLDAIGLNSEQELSMEDKRIFESPTFIVMGRLTAQKRFDYAIHALAILHREHALSNAKLVILGEGELRPELEALVAELKLEKFVHFLGFVGNPYPYLAQAKAFLLSSDYEGFGRVIVDAMATGCPVVSTDCPSGPSEIIQHGKTGVLVPVGDVNAMANELMKIMTNENCSKEMASEGLLRSRDFSVDKIGGEYEEFLKEITR